MARQCFSILVLAMLIAGARPAPASAEEPAFTIGPRPAWFTLIGVTGGGTVAVDTRGAFVGGELSLARLNDGSYLGIYADSYYDFGIDGLYASFGPEYGFNLGDPGTIPLAGVPFALGVDGGVALRFVGRTEVGATGRVSLTINGIFSIYGRYSYFDADTDRHVIQVGGVLKFPLISPFGDALSEVP